MKSTVSSRKRTKEQIDIARIEKSTRNQDLRVAIIHDTLNGMKWVTSRRLAYLCGCHPRSITRDLKHMRETLLLPILDDCIKGLRYEEHVDFIPNLLISKTLFFTLMLAVKGVGAYRSPAQKRALSRTFNKLSEALQESMKLDVKAMDRCLTFGSILTPRFDPERIDYMWRCAVERVQLRIKYGTPGKEISERDIDIYGVRKLKREWVVFCWDSLRKDFIRLSLGRMHNIRATGKLFAPRKFNQKKMLKGALDIYTGDNKEIIRIHFTHKKAHIIRENDVNCEAFRKELPCGGLELGLKVSCFIEVLELIGEFQGDAIPLHPPALVQEFVCNAEKMVAAGKAVLAGTFGK